MPGRPEVEDHQVGPRPAGAREGGLPAGGHDHVEPGVGEVVADDPRDLHLVLDDQDGLHRDLLWGNSEATAGRWQPWPPPPRLPCTLRRWRAPPRRCHLHRSRAAGGAIPRIPAPTRGGHGARAHPGRGRRARHRDPAVAPPHRALEGEQRQEEQREEEEEREEPEAVTADVANHLDAFPALLDPFVQAHVVGADPDADQQQDHQDRRADSEPASHLEPPCRMGPSHPWVQPRVAM